MKEIGGYFGLEAGKWSEYYNTFFALNTGRNCLRLALIERKYELLFVPLYTCDSIIDSLNKVDMRYQFYSIDDKFNPIVGTIKDTEALLYINYFGVCDNQVSNLSVKNLIIDNSQSFFSKPLENMDTFYSCRKFFGVPDGAYLFTNKYIDGNLESDYSENRISHLIKRIEYGAETGYPFFIQNEFSLSNQPIKKMSNLTHHLLQNIDYELVKKRRKENFNFLNESLYKINELTIEITENSVPMVYPLLIFNERIKEKLISNKIYVPTYWAEVLKRVTKDSLEYKLTKYLLPLPIDQRYGYEEMKSILSLLKNLSA